MSLVIPEVAPLPEVTLDQGYEVDCRMLQVMALGIPALVMRDVDLDPETAHLKVSRTVSAVAYMGRPEGPYPFKVSNSRGRDFPPHIDTQVGNSLQVNGYNVQRGRLAVGMFQLQPAVAEKLASGAGIDRYGYGRIGRRRQDGFPRVWVDDELVVPVEYRTELAIGDMMFFTEGRHVHYFYSQERPRQGSASIYHPTPTDSVMSIRSLRQVVRRAANTPYASIFPEVRAAFGLKDSA